MRIVIPFGRTCPAPRRCRPRAVKDSATRPAAYLRAAIAATAAVLVIIGVAPAPVQAQTLAQTPARPAPPGAAAAIAVAREVIEAQLQAFLADDAARAFSFAAPGIQMRFGNAERFVAMVRSAYPAVYRPARYRFLQAEPTGDALVQPVSIEDADGRGWVAVYVLTRQPDTSWRIEGCQLSPEPGSRT